MPQEPLSRELAVIVHVDAVASTTLVQQNETIAHERIQSAFRRFSKIIASYGGTTRVLRGDALVAEYERASDAVAMARSKSNLISRSYPSLPVRHWWCATRLKRASNTSKSRYV